VSGVVLTVNDDPACWPPRADGTTVRNAVRIDGNLPMVPDFWFCSSVHCDDIQCEYQGDRPLRVGDKVTLAHCDTKTTEEVDRWAEASYANPSIVTPPEMGYRPNDDGSWTCRHPHPFATATVAGVKRVDLLGEPEGYVVTVTDVEALS
jgi:hypothetical protein